MMSRSLAHGKPLDVGSVGLAAEQLAPWTAGALNLHAWFGGKLTTRPLELEIGSGKGTFLVQEAARRTGVDFIGIEYARPYWRYAADRCRRHELSNVKLVHVEAGFFLRHYVPDGCLVQVHIYFPDPWPKKRHHKRRFVQESTLVQLHRVLCQGGQVRIVTDHDGYYQWILVAAAKVADRFQRTPFAQLDPAASDELVGSNFERKYRPQAQTFHTMILRKVATGADRCAGDAARRIGYSP